MEQQKYKDGDQIIVQIIAVDDGRYKIKGIEDITFSEASIDLMNLKGVKPGDIEYEVYTDFVDAKVYFSAMQIEDISTKEIKIAGDWFEKTNCSIFDRNQAEELAKEISEKYNFLIIREGLLKEEVDYGQTI